MAKGRKTGGRTAGVPNQITADLKGMILGALADAGGRDYLSRQADKNPGAFLVLVGKVLPMQLTGEGGGPLEIITGVRRETDASTPDQDD
jgi:hypothetical protein